MPSSRQMREMMEQLRAAERSLPHEQMSPEGSRRVAKRITQELERQARPSAMGWIPMLTFVAGAALVLLFLRWSTHDGAAVVSPQAQSPAMAVLVTGADCRSESSGATKVWGACSISTVGPSMTIDTIEASHLEVDDRVVHLRAGSALFDVDPVRGDPIRVAVPQGEIVVVGTRFRVVVGEHRSEVELYEGRLEFHDISGQVTPIVAGQHVGFGRPPITKVAVKAAAEVATGAQDAEPVAPVLSEAEAEAVAPAAVDKPPGRRKRTSKPTPRRTDTSPSEHDAGPVIEAAERLRRQGRYTEAAATLRAALKRRWPTRTADVLSYELGRLLERRIRDQASACSHWRAHLERFGTTRYRKRIERSMEELRCESLAG